MGVPFHGCCFVGSRLFVRKGPANVHVCRFAATSGPPNVMEVRIFPFKHAAGTGTVGTGKGKVNTHFRRRGCAVKSFFSCS